MADVFSRVDWALRSPEFGPLEDFPTSWGERWVVTPVRTPGIDDPDLNWGLWNQWASLPSHRRILEPIACDRELRVFYPAVDWAWQPESIENERVARQVATWGIEIARAFDFIRVCVAESELAWFTCPFVKVTIHGDVRLGFYNPAGGVELMRRAPPEVIETFPAATERACVYAVGQLLLTLISVSAKASKTPLGQVIMRCLDADPGRRFQRLIELRDALVVVGGNRNASTLYEHDRAFLLADQAIGFHELGKQDCSATMMRQAAYLAPQAMAWLAAVLDVDVSRKPPEPAPAVVNEVKPAPPPPSRTRNWRDVRETARMHMEAGRYRDALALFHTSVLTEDHAFEILSGTARAHLLLHEYASAVKFAEEALACDPKSESAHSTLAEARFKRREFGQALAAVSAWTLARPHDGHAHYVAAKALLGLGRLSEARDACERAMEIAPKHLPAMMLRRQINRMIKRARVQAGKSQHGPTDLPEQLRDLRPLLVAGKTAEAIAILERPEHAKDSAAMLLRADLLAFAEQLEAADAVYAALTGLTAGVGRSIILVKLGRPTDALALCDTLVKEHPNAAEAHEARALALQALNRLTEADDEMRRAVAADRQRSQMRVQLAKP
ncbi:MAG: tetratricopeptide repeat protein [Deltaproteobacteria bacterium]|nr:tetratricopeptide repeat protein [Deltaproteobacteria bacterium]